MYVPMSDLLRALRAWAPPPAPLAPAVQRLSATDAVRLHEWVRRMSGDWTPEWAVRKMVAAAAKPPPPLRVSCASLPGLSITCVGVRERGGPFHELVRHVFPVVAEGYRLLSRVAAERGRAPEAHLVYFPLPDARRLPRAGAVIEPRHINGGLATLAPDAAAPWRVLVYRREDAAKVMLHEMVHVFGFDGRFAPERRERDWARRRANLLRLEPPIQRLNIKEAATETLACHLWSVLARVDGAALGARLDEVAERLLRRAPIRDGTHAFSYIVARAALWDGAEPCADLYRLLDSPQTSGAALLRLVDAGLPVLRHRVKPRRAAPRLPQQRPRRTDLSVRL